MSQELKPLLAATFWANVPVPMPRLSEQVRLRLREEMSKQDMSQRDIAGILAWPQSRVAHLLTGRVEMSVDDLAEFGQAVSLAPTELVRDRGMEFCAEMSPSEMRFLERLRQLTQVQRDGLMQLLNITAMTQAHERRAAPPKKTRKAM
jgi:predicted XRE-type DNA-binding protein